MDLVDARASSQGRAVVVVECDLDYLSGVVSAHNADGSLCYRTPATTDNEAAYGLNYRTRRFCGRSTPQVWMQDAIPCVREVRMDTAQLKLGTSLGSFGQVTVVCEDFADDDRVEDPFYAQRAQAPTVGSYFARLSARNPYVQGRALRIGTGFVLPRESAPILEWRHYVIRSLTRSRRGTWELIGVSPLQLMNLRGAQAPRASGWRLARSINLSDTTATLAADSIESSDPSAGVCRMGEELCGFTRSGTALTLTRGQYQTQAQGQDAGEALQPALVFSDATVPSVLRTLLVDYAGIDAALIPTAAWQAEADTWLAQYRLNPLPITEPTAVLDLINELCEQVGAFLWYDEMTRSLRFQALRPVGLAGLRTVTDDDLIGEVAISPDPSERVSRVIVLYARRSALTQGNNDSDYRRRLFGTAFADGPRAHGGPAEKILRSRWFGLGDDALAGRTAFTLAQQLQDGRTTIAFTLSKRDAALDLGHMIRLHTRDLVAPDGNPKPTFAIIVKRSPGAQGLTVDYLAEPFPSVVRYAYVLPNDHHRTYAQTPSEAQDPGWFLSDNSGSLPGGDPAYALS